MMQKRNPIPAFLTMGVLFCSIAGLSALVHMFDLQHVLEPSWADMHLRSGAGIPWRGMLLYMALTAALSPAGVPRQALSALGGYAFGALAGTLLASLALAVGCGIGFFYARLLGRDALKRRFGKNLQRFEAFLAVNPFAMAVAVRFFPFGNNALTTLAAGLTGISAIPFIAGSAIGYIPQTLIFALLGSGIRVDPFWRTLTAALLFAVACALGFLLYKRFTGGRNLLHDNDPAHE